MRICTHQRISKKKNEEKERDFEGTGLNETSVAVTRGSRANHQCHQLDPGGGHVRIITRNVTCLLKEMEFRRGEGEGDICPLV